MTDDQLLAAFEAHNIPNDQFVHRNHLRVAYLYLRRYPPDVALEKIRSGIQALNRANSVPDSPDRGYNETVTAAWMQIVHATIQEHGPSSDSESFLNEQSHLCNRGLLRLFYSREIWTTHPCKNHFVQPDLAPLPKSSKT